MKKIAMTMLVLMSFAGSLAYAEDTTKEGSEKTTTDTSHNPITGKTTHTRKHKKHRKVKGEEGKMKDQETTTTEKTTTDDKSGSDTQAH